MTNTIMTAKNSFAEGLIMDFAPDNTQATCMTSALNATLLTFNGNEMSLQNDMGNGRVETAYLPEGYVPVGTCEFGDIIYIVSYNPLTNKSQIGCFPSPERNISSDEISDLAQILSASDFQYFSGGNPTGQLKATSVKKVLLDSKNLNPGDKYIIYSTENVDGSTLSDYGATSNIYGDWPKLLRLHIVSIDESNKITYLDSDVKWYDNDYYIKDGMKKTPEGYPDLDAYRSLVSSAYSIFQSKNSGKLAILAELEQIDSFNCAYSVNCPKKDSTYQYFDINLHFSWDTHHNDINPSGFAILKSEWVGINGGNIKTYENKDGQITLSSNVIKVPLPHVVNNPYNQEGFFSRLYKPEEVTTYNDYLASSYNTLVKNEHDNIYVGWGQYAGTSNLRSVTRITQKLDNGQYSRYNNKGNYYYNLDIIDNGNYYTRDLNGNNFLLKDIDISDDIVNNYFKKDINISFKHNYAIQAYYTSGGVEYPIDLSNCVWKFTVAPCMPYGVLEHYAKELTIDFSKVGNNTINLTQWKYYNQGELCTLTYGLEANLDYSKKVKELTFDFFDNQGVVATYKSSGKSSYSGVFTENFGLNGLNTNYKLVNVDSSGNKIYHAGDVYSGQITDNTVYWAGGNSSPRLATESDTNNLYINDAGYLYANFLYKVLITISYGSVDELGEFIEESLQKKCYTRWIWTNSMYNDYYYNLYDFTVLPLELDLACTYQIVSNPNYKLQRSLYYNKEMSAGSENIPLESLGAVVHHINQDNSQNGNINMKLFPGLKESYETLFLVQESTNKIQADIYMGQDYIDQSESNVVSETGNAHLNIMQLLKDDTFSGKLDQSKTGSVYDTIIGLTDDKQGKDLWEDPEAYKLYKSTFSLDFHSGSTPNSSFEYPNPETGELLKTKTCKTGLSTLSLMNDGINITLTGVSFNKGCYQSNKIEMGEYVKIMPLLRSQENRDKLNLSYDQTTGTFYFNQIVELNPRTGFLGLRQFQGPNANTIDGAYVVFDSGEDINYNSIGLLNALKTRGFSAPLGMLMLSEHDDNNRYYVIPSDRASSYSAFYIYQDGNKNKWPEYRDTTTHRNLLFLSLYSPDHSFYVLNDVMGYSSGSRTTITQQPIANYQFNNGIYPSAGDIKYYSLGNIIASMFNQVYYKSDEYLNKSTYLFDNYCSIENFNEVWKKHIIVNLQSQENVSYLALANGYSLKSYYTSVSEKIKQYTENSIEECADLNVIEILKPITQVINFQYQIPNSDSLYQEYQGLSEGIKCFIYNNSDIEPIASNKYYDEGLYYKDQEGNLKPLTGSLDYQIVNQWDWTDEVDNSEVLIKSYIDKTITSKNLGKLIQFDKDQLFKIYRYPTKNYFSIGMGKDDSSGSRDFYKNISTEANITTVWKSFK